MSFTESGCSFFSGLFGKQERGGGVHRVREREKQRKRGRRREEREGEKEQKLSLWERGEKKESTGWRRWDIAFLTRKGGAGRG